MFATLVLSLVGSVDSLTPVAAQTPATKATVGTCPVEQLDEVVADIGRAVVAPAGFDALSFYDTASGRPLKDLSPGLKKNVWTVRDEDLTFPATPYSHVDKIVLAWTKRAEGATSAICFQPFRVPANPVVVTVRCGANASGCYAGVGDQIWIVVQDLRSWVEERGSGQGGPSSKTAGDLVPFFHGVAVRGVHPENPATEPEQTVTNFRTYHSLRFTLGRNSSNRDVWDRFLRGMKWGGSPLDVSVGFDGGDPLPTWVQKDKPPASDPTYGSYQSFRLAVLPHRSTAVAAFLVIVSVICFLLLVKGTDIVRDVGAPLRPDGRSPYSLARVQMAIWFFLVMTSWFLLVLVTKDLDTLTESVLVLIGISAGTAVGSAIMDAGTSMEPADRMRNLPADPRRLNDLVDELRQKLVSTRSRPATTEVEREQKKADLNQVAADLSLVQSQQTFFRRRPWLRVVYDLLGDDGHISFHRFQIAVWTLVLAVVFVSRVLSELAMPEFSATILGLMGISSGTYLGFKLPAATTATATAQTRP